MGEKQMKKEEVKFSIKEIWDIIVGKSADYSLIEKEDIEPDMGYYVIQRQVDGKFFKNEYYSSEDYHSWEKGIIFKEVKKISIISYRYE